MKRRPYSHPRSRPAAAPRLPHALWCLIVSVTVASASTVQSNALPADTTNLFETVERRYAEASSFQADLLCTVPIIGTQTFAMVGHIAYRKPDHWRVRLESRKADTQKLLLFSLCDGRSMWTFDSSARVINKMPVSTQSVDAACFQFFPAFSMYDRRSMTLESERPGSKVFRLRSKQKASPFVAATFEIDTETHEIREIRFFDEVGKVKLIVTFVGIRFDGSLPDSAFVFRPIEKIPLAEVGGRTEGEH